MRKHIQELRMQMANSGIEQTPAETEHMLEIAMKFYEAMDAENYAIMQNMTLKDVEIMAELYNKSVEEMLEIRDFVMWAYENKIGIENPPEKHPLS